MTRPAVPATGDAAALAYGRAARRAPAGRARPVLVTGWLMRQSRGCYVRMVAIGSGPGVLVRQDVDSAGRDWRAVRCADLSAAAASWTEAYEQAGYGIAGEPVRFLLAGADARALADAADGSGLGQAVRNRVVKSLRAARADASGSDDEDDDTAPADHDALT